MIISHKQKVIFIKLAKVAGTSFEIALAKYCGADDIITPLNRSDKDVKGFGYNAAQNYKSP